MSEKENNKEPSFKVRDRRSSFDEDEKAATSEESKESSEQEIKEKPKEKIFGNKNSDNKTDEKVKEEKQDAQLPEINFATFILSMSGSAMFHLGDIPNPETGKTEKNLPLSKQSIDILEMLKEKTKGNLTPDEEKLIDNVLYDLRMRYVQASKS